jgi:hypothetical protein
MAAKARATARRYPSQEKVNAIIARRNQLSERLILQADATA